jgi:hypothetical protein
MAPFIQALPEFWHLRQRVPSRREITAKQSWMEDLCVRLHAKGGNISGTERMAADGKGQDNPETAKAITEQEVDSPEKKPSENQSNKKNRLNRGKMVMLTSV